MEKGNRLILESLEHGDFSASIDLANNIILEKSVGPGLQYSTALVTDIINGMEKAATDSPMVILHLGYVYSLSGSGLPADCSKAMQYYEKVLQFSEFISTTRAQAISNLAIRITMNEKDSISSHSRATEYLTMAAIAGNLKSRRNRAVMCFFGVPGTGQKLDAAEPMYPDYFNSTKGQKAICLIQRSNYSNMVHVSEVLVHPSKQEIFLKAIRQSNASLRTQVFGK